MQPEKQFKKHIRDAVYLVKENIDRNPLKIISVTMRARDAGIDRKLLQLVFRHYFGKGIKEYTVLKRLEAGKLMLLEDLLTREQIAVKCGYKSGSSFNTAFKNEYRQTPAQWINQQEE